MGLALVGVWVLTGGIRALSVGDMLTFLTALFAALHILGTDKYVRREVDPLVLNFQQLSVVGILSVLIMVIFGLPVQFGHLSVIWTILYLSLFADMIAYLIQIMAQKYTIPVRVSLIFTLQPIFTALFAWLLHTESFTRSTIIGGALIALALMVSEAPNLKFFKLDKQHI